MSDLLLAIDVGNTNVTLGLWSDGSVSARESVPVEGPALPQRLADALRDMTPSAPTSVAAASVSPTVWQTVRQWSLDALGQPALRVRHELPVGMPLRIEHPETLGDDRLMNAVAGHHRARGAAIVVDFGTATTFEAVSESGEFVGGAIAPGMRLMARALGSHTAQLPEITPGVVPCALGKHTVAAMTAGCFFGQVGMAKEIIASLQHELGGRAKVYATGGDAADVAPRIDAIDETVPTLTLEGIALTWADALGDW